MVSTSKKNNPEQERCFYGRGLPALHFLPKNPVVPPVEQTPALKNAGQRFGEIIFCRNPTANTSALVYSPGNIFSGFNHFFGI
jgi:hypothetical protein